MNISRAFFFCAIIPHLLPTLEIPSALLNQILDGILLMIFNKPNVIEAGLLMTMIILMKPAKISTAAGIFERG
jgi:hypothetical protein